MFFVFSLDYKEKYVTMVGSLPHERRTTGKADIIRKNVPKEEQR